MNALLHFFICMCVLTFPCWRNHYRAVMAANQQYFISAAVPLYICMQLWEACGLCSSGFSSTEFYKPFPIAFISCILFVFSVRISTVLHMYCTFSASDRNFSGHTDAKGSSVSSNSAQSLYITDHLYTYNSHVLFIFEIWKKFIRSSIILLPSNVLNSIVEFF